MYWASRHRLELEQQPAEQPTGTLAGRRDSISTMARLATALTKLTPDRAPFQGRLAEPARLVPAAEQEQRIRAVAAQEVAVDRPPGRPTRAASIPS